MLKLEGQSGSSEKNLSIVSSEDDEAWENFAPMNRYVVKRTQDFVPSNLNAFFGGPLKSLVKVRGSKVSLIVKLFFVFDLDNSHEVFHNIRYALSLVFTPETQRDIEVP